MKTLKLTFFLLLISSIAAAQEPVIPNGFIGEWTGTGTLLGSEAEFEMNWSWVLNDRFLKLEFQNKRTLNSGQEAILNSHAYYQQKNDSLFAGTWFDSRGVTFPVSGIRRDSVFTVMWGSPETEQGKTAYTLISPHEMHVLDYVFQGENFVKFGEAVYQNRNIKY